MTFIYDSTYVILYYYYWLLIFVLMQEMDYHVIFANNSLYTLFRLFQVKKSLLLHVYMCTHIQSRPLVYKMYGLHSTFRNVLVIVFLRLHLDALWSSEQDLPAGIGLHQGGGATAKQCAHRHQTGPQETSRHPRTRVLPYLPKYGKELHGRWDREIICECVCVWERERERERVSERERVCMHTYIACLT